MQDKSCCRTLGHVSLLNSACPYSPSHGASFLGGRGMKMSKNTFLELHPRVTRNYTNYFLRSSKCPLTSYGSYHVEFSILSPAFLDNPDTFFVKFLPNECFFVVNTVGWYQYVVSTSPPALLLSHLLVTAEYIISMRSCGSRSTSGGALLGVQSWHAV